MSIDLIIVSTISIIFGISFFIADFYQPNITNGEILVRFNSIHYPHYHSKLFYSDPLTLKGYKN